MNTQSKYISFCGTFNVPEKCDELETKFPIQFDEIYEGTDSHGNDRYRNISTGFRDGLSYEVIGGTDSMTVWLAGVADNIGHLVASCPSGGWAEETFVVVDEMGHPILSDDFNPNPIPLAPPFGSAARR